jgi:ADP-heptose:LPS heptosyltransferase
MTKILATHHGLRGDLAINVPAIERLKKKYPNILIDMPIHKQFADMSPLFLNHSAINSAFITDDYEKFPNEKDKIMLMKRGYSHILNPMKRHLDDRWWASMHQTTAVLFDYTEGEEILPESERQINLTKWFDVPVLTKTVAFAPFAGYAYNINNDKMLSINMAQKIVDFLISKGFKVLQLGGSNEPMLKNATPFQVGTYFDSVRHMLGCNFLIHTDTGMGWYASAYKHKQLGLYGHRYYGKDNVKNIQPVNPNSLYLDAATVAEIEFDKITEAIEKISS